MGFFEAIEEFFRTFMGQAKPQPIRIDSEQESDIERLRRLRMEELKRQGDI